MDTTDPDPPSYNSPCSSSSSIGSPVSSTPCYPKDPFCSQLLHSPRFSKVNMTGCVEAAEEAPSTPETKQQVGTPPSDKENANESVSLCDALLEDTEQAIGTAVPRGEHTSTPVHSELELPNGEKKSSGAATAAAEPETIETLRSEEENEDAHVETRDPKEPTSTTIVDAERGLPQVGDSSCQQDVPEATSTSTSIDGIANEEEAPTYENTGAPALSEGIMNNDKVDLKQRPQRDCFVEQEDFASYYAAILVDCDAESDTLTSLGVDLEQPEIENPNRKLAVLPFRSSSSSSLGEFVEEPMDEISTLGETLEERLPYRPQKSTPSQPASSKDDIMGEYAMDPQQSNIGKTLTIRMSPTEDTSQGSPGSKPKMGQGSFPTGLSTSIEHDRQGSVQARQIIYLVSLVLAPILIGLLCIMGIELNRVRQTTTNQGASSVPGTTTRDQNFEIAAPGSSNPTMSPSAGPVQLTLSPIRSTGSPTKNPTTRLTEAPTVTPTLSPIAPNPSPITSTLQPTEAPTFAPTRRPISPTPAPITPTLQPTVASTPIPISTPTRPLPPRPPFPETRFTQWSQLNSAVLSAAKSLAYDTNSWNVARTADLEQLSYSLIVNPNPSRSQSLQTLGLGEEEVWNCWINHYEKFDWFAFPDNVRDAYERLGWTQPLWVTLNSSRWPATYTELSWDELTLDEREAAAAICFTQELWDRVPIPNWNA